MAVSTLKDKASALVSSSKFTSGDKLSFRVRVSDSTYLPGNFDPESYLDDLGLSSFTGMSVAVICPDNGGLVAECVRRGAEITFVSEPRFYYHKILPEVLEMLPKPGGERIAYSFDWPSGEEDVDIVLWPDGLHECRNPRQVIRNAMSMLKPGGAAYIEAVMGGMGAPASKVNRWTPSESVLRNTILDECPNSSIDLVRPGRLDNRTIYRVSEEVVVIDSAPERDISGDGEDVDKEPAKKRMVKTKRLRASKKEQKAMKMTGFTLLEVRAKKKLWGKSWVDNVISGEVE